MTDIQVGNHFIGSHYPPFCIAEIGVNHNGSLKIAKELIDVASECGADAVKFQTFFADEIVIEGTTIAGYQHRNLKSSLTQREMLKKYELSFEQHRELCDYSKEKKIIFLSTPHSGEMSVEFLEKLQIPAYKIASGDLTNLPFLSLVAATKKPIFLSTGMGTLKEVVETVKHLRNAPFTKLVLLQCTTEYPCPLEHTNLRAMQTMKEACEVPVGFSDHTVGIEAAVLAVRLGAVCLEKHITLDRDLEGPDHQASMEATEFRRYVKTVKLEKIKKELLIPEDLVETILGNGEKKPTLEEIETAKLVRKSVVSKLDLSPETLIQETDLCLKRPGTGIPPKDMKRLIGKRVKRLIPRDTLISWKDIE